MSPGQIAPLLTSLGVLTLLILFLLIFATFLALSNFQSAFSIDFCNIRGLISNFQSVEHYLSSTKPHLLFLTETLSLLH